jgi:hypothetical protein
VRGSTNNRLVYLRSQTLCSLLSFRLDYSVCISDNLGMESFYSQSLWSAYEGGYAANSLVIIIEWHCSLTMHLSRNVRGSGDHT